MNESERKFEKMVREHRGTIYTVCYMFSNEQDEVADLFQIANLFIRKSKMKTEDRVYPMLGM